MKRVLKLVFTFLIFYLGWEWFPDIITFTGIPAVAVTTLLFFFISIPYELLFIALIIVNITMVYTYDKYPIGFGILTIILCEVSMLLYSIIAIMLLSKLYSGFTFTGGIFALILFAFALTLVNTDPKNPKNND